MVEVFRCSTIGKLNAAVPFASLYSSHFLYFILFYSIISCCVCLWLCWMDNYSCKYRKLMYGSIVIFTIISAFLKFNVLGIKLKSSSLLLFFISIFFFFFFGSLELNLPRKLQNFFFLYSFLTVKFYDILFFLSLNFFFYLL